MLREMVKRLEAEIGHVEMNFPFFVEKAAPVSGVRSLMDYDVTFIGEITAAGDFKQQTRVVVPVTSLCPCSKKISDRGAHNQRSHVTITVTTNSFVWIEEIIRVAETNASSELFGLLKRPEEKVVTERNRPPSCNRSWCACIWRACRRRMACWQIGRAHV